MGLLNSRLGIDNNEDSVKEPQQKETPVSIPSYNFVPDTKTEEKTERKPFRKFGRKDDTENNIPDKTDIPDTVNTAVETKEASYDDSFYEEDDILSSLGVRNEPSPRKMPGFMEKNEEPVRHKIEQSRDMSEEELEIYALDEARKTSQKVKKYKRKKKIMYTALITACVYMIFLIYGVFCTDYAYNDKGEIEPMVLTVSDIRERNNFDKIKVQYENSRVLYEKVLLLDYRLSQGVEDPLTLAPEYEALLDEVNKLTIKIDALDVDTKYETIKQMILNFVKTDTAVYLQKISSGISGNNADDANMAIEYKARMYDDFSLITQNVITIGDNITGSDMTNIKNWSPDKFLEESVGGK